MTLSLAGWTRVGIENGVVLQPPDGTQGAILVRHRQPLKTIAAIATVVEATAIGGDRVRAIAAPRTLVTDEGEYGALLSFATTGGRERRRTIGVVYGDDWMSTVDGRCAAPGGFEVFEQLVERLTMSLALGLGSDRFRRYLYTPPAGWGGLSRFRCDVWLAPGYPQNLGMISVFQARPEIETRARKQHHKLLEELGAEYGAQRSEPQPILTRQGMAGQVVTYQTADGRHAGNVVFSDGRHMYLLRIESDATHRDENTDAFLRVVQSVQSVPWPRQDVAGLIHWSE